MHVRPTRRSPGALSGRDSLKIVPTGQPSAPTIIDLPALTFNAGDAYTVIAVGGANGQLAGALLLNDRALSVKLHLPLIRK